MKNNLKKAYRIFYWLTLLNPIALALLYKFMDVLSDLAMYGGIRRRVPIIAGCGLVLLIWFFLWTIIYHKKIEYMEINFSKTLFRIIFCIELVVFLSIVGSFGMRIIESGMKYNGKLSWKIDEWTRSKKITLEHKNIYEDGIEGIFKDLESKLDLPDELYLVNQFSVKFNHEGTITEIYSFFYGRDDFGKTRTYLLDYNNRKSDKMTVWLDGNAGADYKETEKMQPLFDLLSHVDLKDELQGYNNEHGSSGFELKYFGYHEIASSMNLCVLDQYGSSMRIDDVLTENGKCAGYEFSVYTPDKDGILVTRYMDGYHRIIIDEPEPEAIYEIGKSISVREDGSVYYFLNETIGWRLVVIDAAAGSRWYVIESTGDNGENWNRIEPDPFHGELFGVADSIQFLDEQIGFVLMSGASESHSRLYRTTDDGNSFSMIELPTELIDIEIQDLADHDYITMPLLENNVLKVSLRLEKYDCGSIYFESNDNGETWYYTGVSEDLGVELK